MGRMWPGTAMNAAQHKIVDLLKTLFFRSLVFVSVCVFNVWPTDAQRVDTSHGHKIPQCVQSASRDREREWQSDRSRKT